MREDSAAPGLVTLTKQVVAAGNARDIEAIMGFFSPDSVWDMSPVGLGIFEGRAALRSLFEDWWGGYEDYEQEVETVRELGNGVTFGIYVMRGKPVGSPGWVEQRYAAFATWSDGLIERTVNSFDIDQLRSAAEQIARSRRGPTSDP